MPDHLPPAPLGTVRVKRDGPRGWHFIALADFDPSIHVAWESDPPDHDGDGRKGGSVSGGDDLAALRAEYAEKIGKRPFMGWGAEELRARIGEA